MIGLFVLGKKAQGAQQAMADGRSVYGSDQRFSPTAMLLTGGIVALVGVGLLSMKTDILPTVTAPFEGTMIDLPPPPPSESKIDPEPAKPQAAITAPTPAIQLPNPNLPIAKVGEPSDPIPFTPTAGSEIVLPVDPPVVPLPKPLPDPVLTKAARDPRYASAFQPLYPPAMQRMEKEGRVSVKVLVGSDGRVKDVQILSASDPAFAEATRRQALKSWRFKPATRDGVPQEEWFTTSVVFRLDQA